MSNHLTATTASSTRRRMLHGLTIVALVTAAAACGGPDDSHRADSAPPEVAHSDANAADVAAPTIGDDTGMGTGADADGDGDAADEGEQSYWAEDEGGSEAQDEGAGAAQDEGTVTVVISNGPDAGTYEASGPVNCSSGVWSAQHWDMQYQNDEATEGELRAVLLNYTPEHADDPTVGFNVFSASVSIGPYVYPDEHAWDVVVDGPNGTSGNGNGQLVDSVITAEGATADGIEFTIAAQCSFGL